MKLLRPYLIRAVYDWVVDNGHTPYLLVDAAGDGAQVPHGFVKDGKIIFNLRPEAVHNLQLGDDAIEFAARFGGMPQNVRVPVTAALALYAMETGKGMVFTDEEKTPPPNHPADDPPTPTTSKKPTLRVVK